MNSYLEEVFPIYKLKIETPKVTLRLMSQEEIAYLAKVSKGNIMPSGGDRWMGAWTRLKSPQYETGFFQYHINCIASWRRDEWSLPLGVFPKDSQKPIGVMLICAENFLANRVVKTGSWILREQQGQGYGREIRRGALCFAFDTLGAERARSGAHPDNKISEKVSLSLGYKRDGTEERRDGGGIQNSFLLEKKDWESPQDITVHGYDFCADFFLRKRPVFEK